MSTCFFIKEQTHSNTLINYDKTKSVSFISELIMICCGDQFFSVRTECKFHAWGGNGKIFALFILAFKKIPRDK